MSDPMNYGLSPAAIAAGDALNKMQADLDLALEALRDIEGGLGSKEFPLPDIMAMSPDQFRHAMWSWSQTRARAALERAN